MANASASSATPAAEPATAASVQPQRAGMDPTRPFRYAGAFVWGTIKGALNGLAHGGRKGLWLGIMIGLAATFAPAFFGMSMISIPAILHLGAETGLIANVLTAGIVGFVAGAATSGSIGVLSGGAREIGRNIRAEKYADDIAVKQESRGRNPRYISYRDRYEEQKRAERYNRDRLQQIDNRNSGSGTFWRDLVSSDSRDSGRGL